MKASKQRNRRSKRKTGPQQRSKKPTAQTKPLAIARTAAPQAEPKKSQKLEVHSLRQTGFTEIEEAFFEAGLALCAEHASAPIEVHATEPEQPSWFRRLLARASQRFSPSAFAMN